MNISFTLLFGAVLVLVASILGVRYFVYKVNTEQGTLRTKNAKILNF